MHRGGLGLVIMLTAGCATTKARDSDHLRQACQQDVASDEHCVALLTEPQGGYEARAEVKAAEEARQADAFNDRLARLRTEHEARLKARIQTSTRTAQLGGPRLEAPNPGPAAEDEDDTDALERTLALAVREDEFDNGSSLRAITAAPKPVMPKVLTPVVPTRLSPPTFGPTPEQWLRAGRCLLEADKEGVSQRLTALRGQPGTSRAQLGAMALLLVDIQGLVDRLDAEVAHRKLANPGPLCSSSLLRDATEHLRAKLGAVPVRAQDSDRYGRGLGQLGQQLEIRAGLPPAQ